MEEKVDPIYKDCFLDLEGKIEFLNSSIENLVGMSDYYLKKIEDLKDDSLRKEFISKSEYNGDLLKLVEQKLKYFQEVKDFIYSSSASLGEIRISLFEKGLSPKDMGIVDDFFRSYVESRID